MGACSGKSKARQKSQSKEEEIYRSVFNKEDSQNLGKIDKQSLPNLLNQILQFLQLSSPKEEAISKAIEEIDLDQDYKVVYSEFKRFIENALNEGNQKI